MDVEEVPVRPFDRSTISNASVVPGKSCGRTRATVPSLTWDWIALWWQYLRGDWLLSIWRVRAWPDFDPQTEKSVKPAREWAAMMTGPRIFQKRLDDDFVERSEEYANEALGALAKALS